MRDAPVGKLIVSSSCATFGQPAHVPIGEDAPQRPINPYGLSKLIMEQMCRDFEMRWVALHYFHVCGSDPDGEIGERHDPELHLIPRALMAADGQIAELEILGADYETTDGTCMRDYIHVADLAEAHLAAALNLIV